jgi:hypothetical protein
MSTTDYSNKTLEELTLEEKKLKKMQDIIVAFDYYE